MTDDAWREHIALCATQRPEQNWCQQHLDSFVQSTHTLDIPCSNSTEENVMVRQQRLFCNCC